MPIMVVMIVSLCCSHLIDGITLDAINENEQKSSQMIVTENWWQFTVGYSTMNFTASLLTW